LSILICSYFDLSAISSWLILKKEDIPLRKFVGELT
jgi:hypothetical protein